MGWVLEEFTRTGPIGTRRAGVIEDPPPLRCDGPGCTTVLRVALLDPPMDWITLRWCWPNMAVGTYTAWFCSLGCLDAKVRVWRDDEGKAA